MENAIIKVEESGKDWTLVGDFNDYDFGKMVEFFSDAENFRPALDFAKERARNLVADPTTKDGQIVRKALAKHIGQIEKAIADKGMEVARVLKAKPKEVDAVRKKVKDALLAYKEEVLAPIKEIEARQAEIVEIQNLPAMAIGCDSAGIEMVLEQLEAKVRNADYWKESSKDAEDSIIEARRQLTDMLEAAKRQEEKDREYERLKKEEDERNRKLAEEKAKAEAEAEAAQAAAKKALEDAEKAKAEAEAAKAETEKIRTETGYIEPIFEPSENDLRERKRKVHREAMEKMMKFVGENEGKAKEIITAIALGEIPHIKIIY